MKRIMDHIGIYVNEGGNRIPYKRIIHDHGIPNYIPPTPEEGVYKDMQVDQILFLPIEMDIFNSDRDHYHVGFRYLFTSAGHQTVSLSPDPAILGITKLQISSTVQRFRYSIKDSLDIVIDKVCDPLYPPRIFNIECPTRDISSQTLELITTVTDQLNAWYVDKNV